jgi:hypothetical protein
MLDRLPINLITGIYMSNRLLFISTAYRRENALLFRRELEKIFYWGIVIYLKLERDRIRLEMAQRQSVRLS